MSVGGRDRSALTGTAQMIKETLAAKGAQAVRDIAVGRMNNVQARQRALAQKENIDEQ